MNWKGKLLTRVLLLLLILATLNLTLPGGVVQARRWMLGDQRIWNLLRACVDGALVLTVHEGSSEPDFTPTDQAPAWVQVGLRKITNPAAPLPDIDGRLTVPPDTYGAVELAPFQKWPITQHANPIVLDVEGVGATKSYTYYDFLKMPWQSSLVPGVDQVIAVGGILNNPSSFTGAISTVEDCRLSQFSFSNAPFTQISRYRFPPVSPHLDPILPLYHAEVGIPSSGASFGVVRASGSASYTAFSQQEIDTGQVTYTANTPAMLSDLLTLHAADVERVSVTSDGVESNGPSFNPHISRDGRYVVFMSQSATLPGGDGVHYQAYLRDRDSDGNGIYDEPGGARTILLSTTQDGGSSSNSWDADISDDGRWTVFTTQDGNMVPGDTNNYQDVFARSGSTTTRISVATDGTEANGGSYGPSISENGRYVAFYSNATNLVPGIPTAVTRVYLRDRDTDGNGKFDEPGGVSTTLISKNSQGEPSNGFSDTPFLSADGRYVVYQSSADNIVPGDTNGKSDVFLFDRQSNQTERISLTWDGKEADGISYLGGGRPISDDGRFVTFSSYASNIAPNSIDANLKSDVFVRDRATGQTRLISYSFLHSGTSNSDSGGSAISGDGRLITFLSNSGDLIQNYQLACRDGNGAAITCSDIYAYDQQKNEIRQLSVHPDGAQANGDSGWPAISGDGSFVVFDSNAANLVANDQNQTNDIFAAYVGFPFAFPMLVENHFYLPRVMR